jgi:hypothetical protein
MPGVALSHMLIRFRPLSCAAYTHTACITQDSTTARAHGTTDLYVSMAQQNCIRTWHSKTARARSYSITM